MDAHMGLRSAIGPGFSACLELCEERHRLGKCLSEDYLRKIGESSTAAAGSIGQNLSS